MKKGNMNNHNNKILETVNILKAIVEKISNSHIYSFFLCSLPSSYDTLITAFEARLEDELNPEFIRSKLADENTESSENIT